MSTVEATQSAVLQALASGPIADTRTLHVNGAEAGTEGQAGVKAALDSLLSKEMITYSQITDTVFSLTAEGSGIAESGSHEFRVWSALPPAGGAPVSVPDLKKAVGDDVAKVGQARAFKNKWISKEGAGFVRAVESVVDETAEQLRSIAQGGEVAEAVAKDLQKRKLVTGRKVFHFSVDKGEKYAAEVKSLETDLTAEMIASGAWKDAEFKQYNFAAQGEPTEGGALHPLLKVRDEFRAIFFEMGFSEMPTNHFVESAFWNFDALFVPQQHPARELQDTFYIKGGYSGLWTAKPFTDPATAGSPDEEYYQRVARTHESGGYGSIGYRAPFSREESQKLLLRTHTTAVSTDMLYRIANQPGGFKPAKLFSIDRVFRNEATDATHLAEFHQVEGVVADYNITLGHLIGFMKEFFAKTGVTNLRFKPAFNPYTEPSMEIFAWHEGQRKWLEIGNSGVFRPEMLEPMGLPKGVRVLGWGMSLERPTMIKNELPDIRSLVGHKTDLAWVKTNPAVRLDKLYQ